MRISRARSLVGVVAIVAAGLVTASCCRSPCDRAESTCSTKSTVFQKLVVTNHHARPITVTPVGDYTDSSGAHHSVAFNPSSFSVPEGGGQKIFTSSSLRVHAISLELKEQNDPSSNSYGINLDWDTVRAEVSITMYVPPTTNPPTTDLYRFTYQNFNSL